MHGAKETALVQTGPCAHEKPREQASASQFTRRRKRPSEAPQCSTLAAGEAGLLVQSTEFLGALVPFLRLIAIRKTRIR